MFKWLRYLDPRNWCKKTPKKTKKPSKQPVPSTVENDDILPLKKGNIGVDISHHNRNVDLAVLANNVNFIYMKATEGTTFVSSKYESRAKELRTLDIPWGAYHYYKVNSNPIAQAKHFLKYVDANSGLAPVLDIEGIGNNFKPHHTKDLLVFLKHVEAATGLTPIVYTGYYFAKDKIKPTEAFARYPLWIAWYTSDFSRVKVPKPWSSIKIWQHTDKGSIYGVVGGVDVNKVMS